MKYIIALTYIAILLSGCASTPDIANVCPLPTPAKEGLYHQVIEGETLWRIAKNYNVEIGKIAEANKISDISKIEKGLLLFIPKEKAIFEMDTIALNKTGFIRPVTGKVVSYFGQKRHNMVNNGIDILSDENAPVYAAGDGIVSFCDDKVKGFGKTIIIQHGNDYSTVYTYNSLNLVACGDRVKQGQVIAKAGKNTRSGDYTLHFEIRKKQRPKDPFYYLP